MHKTGWRLLLRAVYVMFCWLMDLGSRHGRTSCLYCPYRYSLYRRLRYSSRWVRLWFFVSSYVVTDKNKLTERDVDNNMPHWEGLKNVKNSLFRTRQSRDGTLNSRRVLTPRNVDIIVHIPRHGVSERLKKCYG